MKKKARLYRAEFYSTCPKEQIGAARFEGYWTMVGFWNDLVDASRCYHQHYWIEIFDAITDKRIVGPLAPGTQMPVMVQ